MSKILIIAEHADGKLAAATAKCVTCAAAIGGEIHVAVFAEDPAAVAGQAAALEGVAQVLAVADPDFAAPLAATIAPEAARLVRDGGYSHLLGPSTMYGKDVTPRVAALLGVNQVSDIMEVQGERAFRRPVYANNAIIDVEAPAKVPVVATVRAASWKEAAESGEQAGVESVGAQAERPNHTRYIGLETKGGDWPDLQTAPIVVSGGRALGSKENFQLVYDFAKKLGAAVGASRAAVDAGYVPNDMQVGQTGKIIAPDVYFAFGISGAIQHLTGIKDAGTIVAVNKDEDAPIFEIADIGLVGDLFTVIPELEKALEL